MNTPLYGRDYELGWLHNRVIRMPRRNNLPTLTLLYGSRGMGKTALLESFIMATVQRQRDPTILFRPEISAGIFGVEPFAESIFRSGFACPVSFAQEVDSLGDRFCRSLQELRRGEAPQVASYSRHGAILPQDVSDLAVPGDPRGHRLSELCAGTLAEMVERVGAKAGGPGRRLCLIFCFDQFADYSPSVKKWVGAVLMHSIMRAPQLSVPSILMTGEESLEASGQRDYWEVPLGRMNEFELKAINRSSCIKWLEAEGVQADLIDEFMEQTKGVPRKVQELLGDKKALQNLEAKLIEEEQGASYSVRQRRWLHAASVLDYVDHESLAVILGDKDAELAFNWLRQQASTGGLTVIESGSTPQIIIQEEVRRKVLNESAQRYPDRHRDFKAKISIQKALLDKVPSSIHRQHLRRLIPIEPFDLEMIEQIYGEHD